MYIPEGRKDHGLRQAYAKIELAKFQGSENLKYPDGTFTLRLAYGTVKGYRESESQLPYATTLVAHFSVLKNMKTMSHSRCLKAGFRINQN